MHGGISISKVKSAASEQEQGVRALCAAIASGSCSPDSHRGFGRANGGWRKGDRSMRLRWVGIACSVFCFWGGGSEGRLGGVSGAHGEGGVETGVDVAWPMRSGWDVARVDLPGVHGK